MSGPEDAGVPSGFVHVYTGNGKGKTTAALGLVIRALGAGWPVLLAQFVKDREYGEIAPLRRLGGDLLTYRLYGRGCFLDRPPGPADTEAARAGLAETDRLMAQGACRLAVLDEICIALHFGLLTVDEVWAVLARRAAGCEVVLTGRYAPAALLARADLVTEMVEIRHYFQVGVAARVGIEC